MKNVLVTGALGQLGKCIADAASGFPELNLFYADREQLDITSEESLQALFQKNSFDYCINAAAYTNVEAAESHKKEAFAINAEGVKALATICKKKQIVLLHVSTDYVFDGEKDHPYLETDPPNPINIYGASKLKGEEYIQELLEQHFIIRTSWLYSEYGHNFLNSMLRFAAEKRDLKITTEQTGTPTNAHDLAKVLLKVIDLGSNEYGLYHFSNEGEATWFDFAKAIFELSGEKENVTLAKTEHYTTFAARPKYSVLHKQKFVNHFQEAPLDWRESLKHLLHKIIN